MIEDLFLLLLLLLLHHYSLSYRLFSLSFFVPISLPPSLPLFLDLSLSLSPPALLSSASHLLESGPYFKLKPTNQEKTVFRAIKSCNQIEIHEHDRAHSL
jgi:hypothetical protein